MNFKDLKKEFPEFSEMIKNLLGGWIPDPWIDISKVDVDENGEWAYRICFNLPVFNVIMRAKKPKGDYKGYLGGYFSMRENDKGGDLPDGKFNQDTFNSIINKSFRYMLKDDSGKRVVSSEWGYDYLPVRYFDEVQKIASLITAKKEKTIFDNAKKKVKDEVKDILNKKMKSMLEGMKKLLADDMSSKNLSVVGDIEMGLGNFRGHPYISQVKMYVDNPPDINKLLVYLQAKYSKKFKLKNTDENGVSLFSFR